MNKRERLIQEVKNEYARLADMESGERFVGAVGEPPPEAYYEKLLNEVLAAVETGVFDQFDGGREIVEAMAGNHAAWGISV
mgnify:CR=1 FL=1